MVKRIKGLKRFGAFVLSLVMAASIAVTVAPEMKVKAAGEYKLVTASDNPEFVHSEWRFADALKDKVGENTAELVEATENSIHYRFNDAYKFKGDTYNINLKLYPIKDENGNVLGWFPNYTKSSFEVYGDGDNGNLSINKKTASGKTDMSFLTIRLDRHSESNKAWDYEVWLTKNVNGSQEIVSYNDVPLIVGTCFDAGNEIVRIYSNDGKITTSVPLPSGTPNGNTDFKGWVNDGGKTSSNQHPWDSPWYYLLGLGYEDFPGEVNAGSKGVVKGGYVHTGGTGAMEMRMGYKAYSIEYFDPDNRFVASTIPAEEFVPVPIGSAYSKPTTPTGIAAQATFVPSHIKIKEIYLGEKENKDVNPEYKVKLEDGTELKAETILSFEDISKLGTILMDHNVEVELYAVPADTKYTLTYHDSAKIVPTTGADNIVTKQPDLASGSKPNNASSYKKGDIVTGLDGKQYRFDGWFTDDGIFNDEFIFGSTPIIKDTDIYAKWTLYEPPTSTPDDPDSDTPSTGEPIKVEFVTPIGNPPPTQIKHVGDKADDPGAPIDPATLKPGTIIDGHRFEGWYLDKGFTMPYNFDTKLPHSIVLYAKWVRVSPKTGDTTIPAVYYVFGALALAGVGAFATKSRKLRK